MTARSQKESLADLGAGLAVQLWQDRESGRLLILSGPGDLPTFSQRVRDGGFAAGLDLVAEVRDVQVVSEVRRWNADMEIPF